MDEKHREALQKIEQAKATNATHLVLDMMLEQVPTEIGQLVNLTKLYLNGNKLTSLPKEIGQLTNLTQLHLENNELTSLPQEIGKLTALTRLDLSSNHLTSLPKEIGQLIHLTELDLGANQLTRFPKEIAQLVHLTQLSLSSNQLTNLPKEIGQLVHLTELYLYHNELTSLPREMGQLTKLKNLGLNIFPDVPSEVFGWENPQKMIKHILYHQNKEMNIIHSHSICDIKKIKGFTFLQEATYTCQEITNVVKEYQHKKTKIIFVLVPGGIFTMGSYNKKEEQPMHKVEIMPFLISKYTVTQEEWLNIMGTTPWKKETELPGTKHPAIGVNWDNCLEFCKKTGLSLPSEAQWEYACRAGSNTEYYWGNDVEYTIDDYVWHHKNSSQSVEVGKKKPNAFGLYDMLGNVYEWCRDIYKNNYYNVPTDGSAWLDKKEGERVLRGGAWHDFTPHWLRCAYRVGAKENYCVGIRACYELFSQKYDLQAVLDIQAKNKRVVKKVKAQIARWAEKYKIQIFFGKENSDIIVSMPDLSHHYKEKNKFEEPKNISNEEYAALLEEQAKRQIAEKYQKQISKTYFNLK